jgi:hypothetical protein
MTWLQENYSLLIVAAIIIVYVVLSGEQSVKNWLLYAVSMAEKELGSGTGKLKLAQVYTNFVSSYPVFSKIVPFAVFSLWVDLVLKEMRKILETNEDINAYVKNVEKD